MPSIAVIGARRRRRGGGLVTVVTDTFTRADNAASLGTADTGQVWTALDGTWGISGNQAYESAGTSTDHGCAVLDAGVSDCTVKVTFATVNGDARLVFRASDNSNNWFVIGNSTNYRLFKWAVNSLVGPVATWASPAANGDVVTAVLSGSSITILVNGTSRLTTTDSLNSTATKHGIGMNSAAGTLSRWDNFSVTVP